MTDKPFSLGGPSIGGLSGADFSLDRKAKRTPAIRTPLPSGDAPVGGGALDIEVEAAGEVEELLGQFQHTKLTEAEYYEKKRKEQARRQTATEYSYYFVPVFSCNADLNVFLTQLGVGLDGLYMDGYELAEKLGFKVPRTKMSEPATNVLEMWDDLALEVPEADPPFVPDGFDPDFE